MLYRFIQVSFVWLISRLCDCTVLWVGFIVSLHRSGKSLNCQPSFFGSELALVICVVNTKHTNVLCWRRSALATHATILWTHLLVHKMTDVTCLSQDGRLFCVDFNDFQWQDFEKIWHFLSRFHEHMFCFCLLNYKSFWLESSINHANIFPHV